MWQPPWRAGEMHLNRDLHIFFYISVFILITIVNWDSGNKIYFSSNE